MMTARFLSPLPGGVVSGEIDIGDISRADWRAIGNHWAEQASQRALIHADKPSIELVQACQVLALYWFATAQTTRTNMHTAIAYRACRLLHLSQKCENGSVTNWSGDQDRGMRCFWACWLTKCASQENTRFQFDCWADVTGCPLPADNVDESPRTPMQYIGKHGVIENLEPIQQNSGIGFNAALVIMQGIWWEVQDFVQTGHETCDRPTEWGSKYCSLSKRLEELPDKIAELTQYERGRESSKANSADQARSFCLGYFYHLCVVYLHSSIVPALSYSRTPLAISRVMIRLAAEQAWEHSVSMTTMADQFIARRATISKLWPVVGYGAYVCAVIQLRRFLALRVLTHQHLQEMKVHLLISGELSKYWMTLQPLHEDLKQQFSQAHALISSRGNCAQEKDEQSSRLMDQPNSGPSPELSSYHRVYVANRDARGVDRQLEEQNSNTSVRVMEAHDTPPATNVRQAPDFTSFTHIPGLTSAGERHQTVWESTMQGTSGDLAPQSDWTSREDGFWWNQDPSSLNDLFSGGFFLHDDIGF
ncbi:hypothetical protein TSTA_003840 [Talaromyces stipitatus ATCC 10500]|uniref:Xylanolytic transcriptional activator regulatory domain-containing protein n=1 Tax=Talaromyces stipitatus (strain ATCC 10500 / CBS 375.48 / QM 6759 / NRRL 1006) TaxID=441959 RepID=B8MSE1_TALSN|nr:uncharacterized protein TSTA_003840 [Talaromyces stipitatus ATCC 10500]EED12328.1 hypothetical protein TSTA_003840 [Talaromyces stipitatus ATCC 10500]